MQELLNSNEKLKKMFPKFTETINSGNIMKSSKFFQKSQAITSKSKLLDA
jgi:hypothetical protein